MGWWRHPRTIPLITLALCTVLLLHTMVLYRHSTATDTSPLAEYAPQDTLFIPHRHSSPDTEKPQPILPDNPVNFAALQAESPDVVAWIKVPNTIINFPVMQSDANTEEDFYLHSEAQPGGFLRSQHRPLRSQYGRRQDVRRHSQIQKSRLFQGT